MNRDLLIDPMATINELPNELLINIFEHIAEHDPRPINDFVSLSFTSRRFRTCAEPYLYHTYEERRYTMNYCHQHLFAETLLEQPRLANHVRKLDLALHRVIEDRPWLKSATTTRANPIAKLQNAVEQLGLPSPITKDWKYAIEGADQQAYAAHILFSASGTVEDLCLRYEHRRCEDDSSSPARWHQYNWLFVALRLATMQQGLASSLFQNLRTLKVVRQDGKARPPLSPLSFVFRLPHLRHFEAHGHFDHKLGASPRSRDTGALPQDGDWHGINPSPIEIMVFRNADLGSSTISLLLRTCKALKHFELEVVSRSSPGVIVDGRRIDQALHSHAGSLESIRIDIPTWEFDQHVRFSLTSLPHFARLRSLKLPMNVILPPFDSALNSNMLEVSPMCQSTLGSYLPLAIEYLSISVPSQQCDAFLYALYDYVEMDLKLFTKLRRIHVLNSETDLPRWFVFKEILTAANIEFIVSNEELIC